MRNSVNLLILLSFLVVPAFFTFSSLNMWKDTKDNLIRNKSNKIIFSHNEGKEPKDFYERNEKSATNQSKLTVDEKTENPKNLDVTFNKVFEHLHNKIVHFPVALLILAFALSLFQLKWERLDYTIKILVFVAFFTSIFALITGKFQEEVLEGTPKESLVEIHEKFAYATTFFSLVWIIFLNIAKLRKFHIIIGLIIFILISITGFYGGLVAH